MINLLPAIGAKLTGSALAAYVGDRMYPDQAPKGAAFPYVVFSVVTSTPENTFAEKVTETTIQFSLFSSSDGGIGEVSLMYANLRALFDDAVFPVTSNTLLRCTWQNMIPVSEDVIVLAGKTGARHWAVDYLMTMEAT